jgi:transitional endoplasmic reticulum ATPase
MSEEDGLELTVKGAQKRDAGRGVARVPEAARKRLGVLSGDTVVVEGDRETVVKVWPAGAGTPEGVVRIDADARSSAGVSIGGQVRVRPVDVSDAESVVLAPTGAVSEAERETVERVVGRDLRDRPVAAGERVRIQQLGAGPFVITDVEPSGTVKIDADTTVTVLPEGTDEAAAAAAAAEPGVTYEDIGGLDEELEQVRETVELPLSDPDLFRRAGVDPPKGVLLYGPPGTGKTLIAKAVANEVDAEFVDVSGPEIMGTLKGESEQRLREIFAEARENAPAVVYFDEIDAIAEKRGDSGDTESRVVAQLLSLMDGLDERGEVVVVASTNRVDAIDPALRRGGRFDREIQVGVPDEAGRREIFAVHTRDMPLAEDVDLDRLAARTHGFVGADVDALATEAGMAALRRVREGDGDREDLTITRADFETAMAAVEPSAMREYVAETPAVDFDDVGGLDDAKRTLREAVEWPLSYGPLFEAANAEPPSGLLLYGPPGTGKTLLARAIASESDVNFIHVAGPEVMDRYVGESEEAVREVFDRARQAAPAIVFFDEIDAIAGHRGPDTHEVSERVVSQLLTELDGLAENPNIVVLAATNRREAIDDALLRPGRLEEHLLVPEPDEAARREILAVHTREKPLAEDVDLDALAADLEGYTGAEIDALVRAAAMRAVREVAEDVDPGEAAAHAGEVEIRADHVAAARERLDADDR